MKPLAQNTLIQNRYLIVQLIGKGGMGEVYLAVDQRLGSAVALKRTFFAGDEMLSNAFEREARILARMRHPVLPKVSDHFSEGEEQYLVMEHISGDDLAKRLEAAQKPFPLSWVMFWADQLLDSLSYLHSHEPPIIHRDIKPQNLKLTDENHVILLDFGLSKNTAAQPASSGSSSSGSTGSVVGYTPHYAPMEQIRGIGTSPKSDIYSLSATLYQLLTNAVPPDALSRADTLLNGSPDPIRSPSEINSEVPIAVSEVILRGMEVSQDKRYDTAREMQKALRKAHAQMQEAMSAHTVVMTAEGTEKSDSIPVGVPSMDKTEVMDFSANPLMSVPTALADSASRSEAPTNLVSHPTPSTPAFDPNATVAFEMPGEISHPIQADVKTEVFIAGGSNSLPIPPDPEPVVYDADVVAEESEVNGPGSTGQDYSGDVPSPYVADATMPIIAFNELSNNADSDADEGDFDIGNEPIPRGFNVTEAASADSIAKEPSFTPAPAAVVAPKKSGGKAFAIVGGLLVLFLLGAAALGGGWYYYANYYAAAEPEPSPSPTVEPTPEPTIDFAATNSDNSNVDVASDSNTNANSNSADLTVAPTPTPDASSTPAQTVASRPERPSQPGQTATKPAPTKPTTTSDKPKTPPSTTRDRKRILQ